MIPHYRVQDIGYKGISFPFRLDGGGRVAVSSAPSEQGTMPLIREAVTQLLLTHRGERFFNYDFHAAPVEIVFRLNTPEELNLAISEIDELLRLWEPRLVITDYSVEARDPEQGYARIQLSFEHVLGQTQDKVEVRYG